MDDPKFEELYRNVPAEQREAFCSFRASHPYRQIDCGRDHWEYITSGQGEEALLILGGGLSVGESSFRTILRLEDRFRVLSPTYPPAENMRRVADGLAAILDQEGLASAHVFGHSLGAGVGHIFVRLHPERVEKLILDGFGLYTHGHVRAAKLFLKLPYPLLRSYYRRAFDRLLSGTEEGAFMKAYVEELFTRLHTRETILGQFRLLVDIFDHGEEYSILRPVERPGRVLLILAEDDRGFTPQERQALKDSYPGAQLFSFASGGHLSGWTRREEFNQAVDSFLQAPAS